MNLQCSLPPAEALLIVSAVRRAMLDGLSDEAICALPALMRLPLEERARVVAGVQEHPDTLAMIARRQRIAKRRRWFPGFTDPRTGEISNLGCLLGCLLYIPGIPLVALGSARLAKPWIDRLVLNATFGPGKYEAGLRIVKKSFLL